MLNIFFQMPLVVRLLISAVVFILAWIISGYTKARPNEAIIISGPKRKPRSLIGRSGFVIPIIERKDYVRLDLISVDVKTSSPVPTADFININVDSVVNIKISDNPDLLRLAAQNFLNKDTDYIAQVAREVLEGNMREIVGTMSLPQMVNDRKTFSAKVQENAEPDLGAMGLEIISFNVQNFTDKDEVITNLGIDNISKIRKGAAIARAQSEKDIAVAEAEALAASNEAKVKTQELIAQRENDLSIRKSELKIESDLKKAEADAAYLIKEQEQKRTLEIKTVEATIARAEQEVSLNRKNVENQEQILEAQYKKKAEADKFVSQQEAEAALYARMKEAEAKKYEQKQQAEAIKLMADATRYQYETEAQGIKARGEAEAAATQARLMAEAEGIRAAALAKAEGLEKEAEAMRKMGEAKILEMYFNALPQVAASIAEPLSKVDKITMYGDGNTTKMMKDIVQTVTQVSDGLTEGMGLDLKSMLGSFIGTKMAIPNDKKEDESKTDKKDEKTE